MNTTPRILSATLALLLAGGLLAVPAHADLPKPAPNIVEMDTDKNGTIEKAEFLAFMEVQFDKSAAGKGYCTYEEIETGARTVWGSYEAPGPNY